ncbi:helix-turn-helix domain-containing protein [Candidatus Kaiserbacteria bacterium]|nr:helix-turn-helix domain-containing protein [Candidatus Kaiserbacteria bacterium]USN91894.1 MAG: helix-turn-helix domain-containing protein [Candidatus Nomurabacteria bacterium]
MSKNLKHVKPSERKRVINALYKTARSMPQKDPVVTFISSVLTESEQVLIGRRLLIAQMILAGKKQTEIAYELDVSPNTFSRTKKWLSGQIPEYDKALKEYRAEQNRLKGDSKLIHSNFATPFSFTALRKKYPAHFLLFALIYQVNKKTD